MLGKSWLSAECSHDRNSDNLPFLLTRAKKFEVPKRCQTPASQARSEKNRPYFQEVSGVWVPAFRASPLPQSRRRRERLEAQVLGLVSTGYSSRSIYPHSFKI